MFSFINISQMSFNFIEQSKNKNKLLRGEEEQDGLPSHLPPPPPPPPVATFGPGPTGTSGV